MRRANSLLLPYVFLAALSLISLRLCAQTEPPSSEPVGVSREVKSPGNYAKEAYVVEQWKERVRFENDGTGQIERTARVRIQSEAALVLWGQLRFGFNSASETLEVRSVRVIKGDGSVINAGADAVKEMSTLVNWIAPTYSDYREKHVTVPGLRPGDVLEFDIITSIKSAMAPGQFWFQHDFQSQMVVMDEQLEVTVPAERLLKLKTKAGMEPTSTVDNGYRIYRWKSAHLSTSEEDKEQEKAEQKKSSHRRPKEATADVQLTTFRSWAEVGQWYSRLEKPQRTPSEAVRRKAEELTRTAHSDLERVEALYDFTAKNFRYVSLSFGIGAFQPHAADEVLRNQYGDCKDKASLLAALLASQHIQASTVLINAGKNIDPEVPSPAQFNHAITMVKLGNEQLWLDSTTEVAPFRVLHNSLRKKKALVVPLDGAPYIAETPANSPEPDLEDIKIEGKVDDSGTLSANVSYTLRGDAELTLRQSLRLLPQSRWQALAEQISTSAGLGKGATDFKATDPAATHVPFTLSFHISKRDFVDPLKKSLKLKLPDQALSLATASEDDAKDSEPIKLGAVRRYHYRLQLEFPPRYTVHLPVSSSLSRDYASFRASYSLDKSTAIVERDVEFKKTELASGRVQDYLAFRRAAYADLAQQISLETVVPGASELAADLKPEDLLKRGNEARRRGDYALAIEILQRATQADSVKKSAWNSLGLAYFDARNDEAAIDAYKKAIELNAYDPYAYNNLGRVYLRQRRYEDAVHWFEKQREVSPLDVYVPANIGQVYLEQQLYAKAIPELEKAASLNPDSSGVQLSLGNAYLGVGDDAKAMAAFDTAVKLSNTSGTWNDIAYLLSKKGVHLDLARRYAESAVSSTEASLRNISLDHLRAHDLGLVRSLALFWDTLGWVEFADGHSDKALPYLLAAGQLGDSSGSAQHAAEVYEKLGDRQSAIHFYALALNGRRPEVNVRLRLVSLLGGEKEADAKAHELSAELERQRTVTVDNSMKLVGKADFFVLLDVAPDSPAGVSGVRFISGNDELKALTEAITRATFHQSVPDGATVKLLRRGTLTCTAAANTCDFLLWYPVDVRSEE